MRKFLLAAIALGAVAATAVPAQAQQRCREALNQWSSGAASFNSQRARADARDEIDAAQQELRRGNDERCVMHVQRAMRIYDEDKRFARDDRRDDRRYSDRRYDDRSDRRFDDRTEGSGGGIGDILRGLGR